MRCNAEKLTYTDVFLASVFRAKETDVVNARRLRYLPVKPGHAFHMHLARINNQIANLTKEIVLFVHVVSARGL